jgi:UDPglucose 6-dehydrogenase
MAECKRVIGDKVTYLDTQYEALDGVDALLIATEWSDFREPDFDRMKDKMKEAIVFDGRNIYNPEKLRGKGFEYTSIGRP